MLTATCDAHFAFSVVEKKNTEDHSEREDTLDKTLINHTSLFLFSIFFPFSVEAVIIQPIVYSLSPSKKLRDVSLFPYGLLQWRGNWIRTETSIYNHKKQTDLEAK